MGAWCMASSSVVAQLIGATLFTLGSGCFAWQAFVDDWVDIFKTGCALWIGGCVVYLWPPLYNQYNKKGVRIGDLLQLAGMVAWIVGSAYGFHDDLDSVGLPVVRGGFLAGSVCLLLDALLQVLHAARTPGAQNEMFSVAADVLAGLFYMIASVLGGFATDIRLVRIGNLCWIPGSLLYFVRPCLALFAGERMSAARARRQG